MMVKAPCKDCPDRDMKQISDKQVDFKFEATKMKEGERKEKMSNPCFSERKWKR